jgi:hypothetical protein
MLQHTLATLARFFSGDSLAGTGLTTSQIKALAAALPGTLMGNGDAVVAPLGVLMGEHPAVATLHDDIDLSSVPM